MSHADPIYQLEHRQKTVAWSSQLVTELSRALRASRVLYEHNTDTPTFPDTDRLCRLAFVVFWTCFDQMQNNLISQAGSMQTHGTPNDMLTAMNQVSILKKALVLVLEPCGTAYVVFSGTLLHFTTFQYYDAPDIRNTC
jgi:POT family proton-dependent oligopeptide transporter